METKESYRDRQENELLVLKSIFAEDDVIDLRLNNQDKWHPLDLKISLEPQKGSRSSVSYCKVDLRIICPKNYPKCTPKIHIENAKGLANSDITTLMNQLNKEAYSLKGEVMIFELCQLVQSFLHERNVKPKGSFYDQMVENKQKRDQDELTMQKEKEEKMRQKLQDEVLKRKEQLKKEHRIRRSTANESPMRHISSESSNYDDRNFAEICDEHKHSETLYFPLEGRKILRGACLGHSMKGCVNYSGIDLTTGKLYYLAEWTIKYSLLESKNLNVDEVIEMIEKKMAALIKIRHKNLVSYDGCLCLKKKDNVTIILVQEFLLGITVCSMSACWNWSAECVSGIAKCVLEALIFLHNNGVSHGNLLDSSVFIDANGSIKVSDYSIVPYLQDLITGVAPSIDLPALGALIESLIPTPHLEMRSFINECQSERTLSASDLLEHPFLYTVLMNHNDSQSPIDNKLMLSCPPPVPVEKIQTNINLPPTVIAPLISSNHSRLDTEFELINYIGKGAYGDVLKVRNILDNRQYAIKRIPLSSKNKQLFRKMTREVELLSRLNHENVVRYFNSWIETQSSAIPMEDSDEEGSNMSYKKNRMIKTHSQNQLAPALDNSSDDDDDDENLSLGLGWNNFNDSSSSEDDSEDDGIEFVDSQGRVVQYNDDEDDDDDDAKNTRDDKGKSDNFPIKKNTVLYIQMEFCEKSTLRSAIDAYLYQDHDRYWKLFREIVEGLSHIHQQGMIHRDLKCENIFLDSRDHVKIGDFGLATTNVLALQQNVDANQSLKVPQLSYGDSNTGHVGTALYVAPELMGRASKSTYNQKVDLYSLGVIFFEMCTPPLTTGMERIHTIAQIRKPEIIFPANLSDDKYDKEKQVLKWLLDHNPSKRPTSEELLQSELMPPAKVEASELQEMLRHVLINPQSRSYKHLISRLIQQECTTTMQFTYHMQMIQISSVFENVKCKIEEVFRKHGAVDVQTPLLSAHTKNDADSTVRLMTHSGLVVTLPSDLRYLFLRYVVVNGVNLLRRYSIGRVYREKKQFNFHPKQSYECEFDIVTPTRGNFLVDAELLVVAHEIISEFDVLKQKNISFKINHTSLLRAIFLYYSVPTTKYKSLLALIKQFMEDNLTKYQLQSSVTSLLPAGKAHTVNALVETLLITDIPLSQVSSTNLKVLIKGRGEASALAKGAIRELEAVIHLAQFFGVNTPIHLSVGLSMDYDCSRTGSIIWQMRGESKKRKPLVIASGGRYDHQIEDHQKLCQRGGMTIVNREMYVAGFSLAIDRLVACLNQLSDTISYRSVVDLLVMVTGSRPPLKEICHLMKSLWSADIKCCYIESQSQDDEDVAKDLGANHIIVLGEDGCLRIKSWQNDRYFEKSVSKAEVIEYLKKNLGMEINSIAMEPNFIVRNSSLTSMPSIDNSSSILPSYEIIWITNEKINSNKKKRLENQIEQKLSGVLMRFSKKETFVIFAIELETNQIRSLVSCIDPNPKDQSQSYFDAILKGFPKNKQKYLLEIYDEITEKLVKNKNTIAGIYGISESYYRIIL